MILGKLTNLAHCGGNPFLPDQRLNLHSLGILGLGIGHAVGDGLDERLGINAVLQAGEGIAGETVVMGCLLYTSIEQ